MGLPLLRPDTNFQKSSTDVICASFFRDDEKILEEKRWNIKNLWRRKRVRRAIFRNVELRVEGRFVSFNPYFVCNTDIGRCMSHRPYKTDFENENYILILYLFCTILYTESQILYIIPSCAIGSSNLEGAGDMQPPLKCNFNINNWIIILYSFCTILYIKFHILYTFLLVLCAIQIWGLVKCSPPKCSFNIKNWIINFYSVCAILYTKPH